VNDRVLMFVGAASVLAACSAATPEAATDSASASVAATVVTVEASRFTGALDAIGAVTVRPGHIAALGASGATRVRAVRVAVGDRVRAGAVLIELDPAPFDAAVQAAAAALLSSTRAQERAQRLVDAGIAPRKDLDLATSDLAQATAAHAAARRQRALAMLRSPIAGVVTQLTAILGAGVDGGSSLIEIADPRFVDVVLAVSADEAAAITAGASVELTSGSAERADTLGTGTVSAIAAAIDTATRTVSVRVAALQTKRALRIGESINGRIALAPRTNVVLVPAAAVVPDGDAFRVFVVDSARIAHARTVEVGARRDGRIEITAGLKPGERIVTDGAYQVDDGVRVTSKPE
jgi:RND family efflux transporter MFP subunit